MATAAVNKEHLNVSTRGHKLSFWLLVGSATAVGTFIVPFFFPLKQAVFSPAYTAGGNNKLGAMIVALISAVTSLLLWRLGWGIRPARSIDGEREVPRPLVVASILVTVIFSMAFAVTAVKSGIYYADSGYFITQLRSGLLFHRKIYQGFEFAYGPLLYYIPALFIRILHPFQIQIATGYFASLLMVQIVGVFLVDYTVSALALSRRMRIAAFIFILLLTFDPQAGLNYTAFRFVLPCANVVLLARQQRVAKAAMVALAGVILQFLVSPELGIAFLGAAIVCSVFLAWKWSRQWAWIAPAALAGAVAFALVAGRAYFRTMFEFMNGGFNELLAPAPHIYVLLLFATGLAPLALAGVLQPSGSLKRIGPDATKTQAVIVLGLYVVGLAMLSPALGRCDPLHVSWNGIPLFLVGFVALNGFRSRGQLAGVAIAGLFCIYTLGQEYALVRGKLGFLAGRHNDPFENVDMTRLEQQLRGSTVAFPLNPPMRIVDGLTQRGEYLPLYLCIPPAFATAEDRTVEEMRNANYVLLRNDSLKPTEDQINNTGIRFKMRFGYTYKSKKDPYLQGEIILDELRSRWRPVGVFGSYILFQKLR